MARTISVEILGDSTSVERAFARSSQAAQRFNKQTQQSSIRAELGLTNIRRQAVGIGASFVALDTGARLAAAGLKTSIDAASNLNEQTAKAGVVFGDSAREIEDWSKTTARSFGIAQDQALEAAGSFGNLFRTVKIGQATSAEMSRTLVELAADLASFSNTDPSDALDALRSGLIGEAEPLRRYGVLLSEARVQQVAMAETGKTTARALTDQEKALARYSIILADTKTAQGDFNRTQEGFANQLRTLRAELRDFSATVGNFVIPKLTELFQVMNDGITVAGAVGSAFDDLRESMPEPAREAAHWWGEFVKQASPVGWYYRTADAVGWLASKLDGASASARQAAFDFSALNALTAGVQPTAGLRAKDIIEARGRPQPPPPLTTEQRRTFFDAEIARQRDAVQDIANLQGQITKLEGIRAKLQGKLETTRDPTRRLNLEREILDVNREIRSVREQMHADSAAAAADAKQHAEDMKRLAEERAEAERVRRETRQFRALGLGPGGADLVPGIPALRRRLARVGEAIKGTPLDTKSRRSLLGRIRDMLTDRREWGKLGDDVRNAIESIFADIDRLLDKRETKARRPRGRVVSTANLLAGLGLSPEELRLVSNKLAAVDRYGRVPTSLGGGGARPGTYIVINGGVAITADNADVVARELQKRARRTAAQTRGTRPGSTQGID